MVVPGEGAIGMFYMSKEKVFESQLLVACSIFSMEISVLLWESAYRREKGSLGDGCNFPS